VLAKTPEAEGEIGAVPGIQPIVPRHNVPRRITLLSIAIGFAAIVCVGLYLLFFGANKPIDSIAVLPLENVGADPNTEYLSDGITEGIINKLAQLSHLRVAPRPTVFSYKGKLGDPLKTGRELNVRAVFTGKLLHRGERYIVQADLIDVREESQLLGEQYNIATSAIPSLSRDISQKIVERLRMELSNNEQKELSKVPTENSEAYRHYLRGRNYAAQLTNTRRR
jgi:TolB-like protein